MNRFILDTNIIREITRARPRLHILEWVSALDRQDVFIAALSIGEIWKGVLRLANGRKKQALIEWFEGAEGPPELFKGQVLAFDTAEARVWARLMADGEANGYSRCPRDTMIAATAVANNCVVVTCNAKDFFGVDIVDPGSFAS